MECELNGTYHITMVLPAWTVENDLTLCPEADGVLNGTLDLLNGEPLVRFTHGRWNKNFFQIDLSVGPGQLQLTGTVEGDVLSGVVTIQDTPDCLSGIRVDTRKN